MLDVDGARGLRPLRPDPTQPGGHRERGRTGAEPEEEAPALSRLEREHAASNAQVDQGADPGSARHAHGGEQDERRQQRARDASGRVPGGQCAEAPPGVMIEHQSRKEREGPAHREGARQDAEHDERERLAVEADGRAGERRMQRGQPEHQGQRRSGLDRRQPADRVARAGGRASECDVARGETGEEQGQHQGPRVQGRAETDGRHARGQDFEAERGGTRGRGQRQHGQRKSVLPALARRPDPGRRPGCVECDRSEPHGDRQPGACEERRPESDPGGCKRRPPRRRPRRRAC